MKNLEWSMYAKYFLPCTTILAILHVFPMPYLHLYFPYYYCHREKLSKMLERVSRHDKIKKATQYKGKSELVLILSWFHLNFVWNEKIMNNKLRKVGLIKNMYVCKSIFKSKGPIIYFIDGRSLSRYKLRFFIYQVP